MFSYPCKSRRVTSPYGPRNIGDKFHDGIDFGVLKQGVEGDEIYSTADGVIAESVFSKSYGNRIIINHKNSYSSIYGHLKRADVKVGQEVKQGQVIGLMGNTGNSTGPHLHFEVRNILFPNPNYWKSVNGKFSTTVDPKLLLQELEIINTVDKNLLEQIYKNLLTEIRTIKQDINASMKHLEALETLAKEAWDKLY